MVGSSHLFAPMPDVIREDTAFLDRIHFYLPGWEISYTASLSTVLEFFHLENFSNASREEAIYLHTLYSHLLTQARLLAAILPWSVQRPLQALRAAMNEPGRNCSVQSAKRKPLSGSPVSSRKHSSTA